MICHTNMILQDIWSQSHDIMNLKEFKTIILIDIVITCYFHVKLIENIYSLE